VANRDDCKNLAKAVIDKFGRIDVLINNAGITQPVKFEEITPEGYDRILEVNLCGMLYMSQAVVPHMKQAKSGSIVNTSSVSAQRGGGIFGGPHYSAAKGGMLGLGKAMARELGAHGIRVNAVTPGLIATDITTGKLSDTMEAKILEGIPLARLGRPPTSPMPSCSWPAISRCTSRELPWMSMGACTFTDTDYAKLP
jgi:NAD(P)-dependent dehydrogenase (short-subunit alcohol dehydrogenase family)